MEDADQCWDYETLSALSLQPRFYRPFILARKCPWLVLQVNGDAHFDASKSTIALSGPSADALGVALDTARQPIAIFNYLVIPFCIEKDAAAGEWTMTIETRDGDSGEPFVEQIVTQFEIQ
jgi:hypothetical protein